VSGVHVAEYCEELPARPRGPARYSAVALAEPRANASFPGSLGFAGVCAIFFAILRVP
jgi:hypothetical protein